MNTIQETKTAKANATENLRKFAPEGSTIYCVLRSVSKSGMSRRIDFYAIADGSQTTRGVHYIQFLSGWISQIGLGSWHPDKSGLRVNGCGMDMGFHVVYELSHALYGNANALRSEWI